MSAASWNRKVHRWGAVLAAAPLIVICATGLLLQLKKDWGWVQPSTRTGADPQSTLTAALSWDAILEAARQVPEAEVATWDDVDRLDVRPGRGLIKVRCVNRWELQLDASSGALLSSTYRRSDLIEAIHDGSWFHPAVKLWIFLPAGVVLCGLWGTGMYLWFLPGMVRRRRKKR